jgi:hypothetical protein
LLSLALPSATGFIPSALPLLQTDSAVPMPGADSCDDLAGNMRIVTSTMLPCCRSGNASTAVYVAVDQSRESIGGACASGTLSRSETAPVL